MDRSLPRRPREGCEARVRRGTRQCGTGASKPRSRDDDGGRLAPRVSGAVGREARILWGSWRGLTVLGRVLCGCVLGHVRGRCAGPPRWGGSRIGGSVGLLWVHDAGPRGLDAASRSANQTSTPLGAIAAQEPLLSATLSACRRQRTRPIATKHAGESSADLNSPRQPETRLRGTSDSRADAASIPSSRRQVRAPDALRGPRAAPPSPLRPQDPPRAVSAA